MSAIEAVVFDWDRTLVDSKRVLVASFQETTREVLGTPFPTEDEDVEQMEAIEPFPGVLETAIGRLGADPGATLYVGDGPNDVRAGRDAGAITAAVSFGFHPEEARAEAPDHMIDEFPQLLGLAGVAPAAG